jgi:hypothetical protein
MYPNMLTDREIYNMLIESDGDLDEVMDKIDLQYK